MATSSVGCRLLGLQPVQILHRVRQPWYPNQRLRKDHRPKNDNLLTPTVSNKIKPSHFGPKHKCPIDHGLSYKFRAHPNGFNRHVQHAHGPARRLRSPIEQTK